MEVLHIPLRYHENTITPYNSMLKFNDNCGKDTYKFMCVHMSTNVRWLYTIHNSTTGVLYVM